jgi:dihydrofolate reductase
MSQISIIAAVDEVFGIGANNHLLCHLPADLQYFKSTTMKKPILMGRATFESIGRPLPGRLNVVLSKQGFLFDGVTIFDNIEEAFEALHEHPEIMIIGGASIYEQTIHMASHLYITHIHHQFSADAFFPALSPKEWNCLSQKLRHHDESNQYDMTFAHYERV